MLALKEVVKSLNSPTVSLSGCSEKLQVKFPNKNNPVGYLVNGFAARVIPFLCYSRIGILRLYVMKSLENRIWVAGLLGMTLQSVSLPSIAQESSNDPHSFDGRLGAGYESDSTVIVDAIDSMSDSANIARTWQVNLNYDYQHDEEDKLSLSLNHITRNFEDDNQFDSRLLILSGTYSHDYERHTVGVRNQLIRSTLSSEDFLNTEQISPYISFFIGRQWFLNVSFTYADKIIKTNNERSAISYEMSTDVYYFFKGVNHYLLFGYRSRDEEAKDDLFNYDSSQLRVSWLKKVHFWNMPQKFRLNWRYQNRTYEDVIHPDINAFREDNRRQWEAEWEMSISDDIKATFSYRRNEQDSNLATASYDQNTKGLTVQYHF